jgi:hypothetical protein
MTTKSTRLKYFWLLSVYLFEGQESRIPNWSETECIFTVGLIKALYSFLSHGLSGHHNEHILLQIVFGSGQKGL